MINLLFTGNDKIVDGLSLALISIANHCKEMLNVIVLTMDLQEIKPEYKCIKEEHLANLVKHLQSVNLESRLKVIDITEIFKEKNKDSVNIDNMYSPYAFIRLLADEVEEVPDKVIYLDIDILANGDIKELWDIDVSNVEYGAARDYYGKIFISPKYINSGVMLLNMAMIRHTKLFEKCRHFVNTKKAAFPDQTALNKFVEKRIIIPGKFNSQRRLREGDVIRHFCKSIRFYPSVKRRSNPVKKHCRNYPKYFPIFHTLNIKSWDKLGVQNVLGCRAFDNVYEKYEEIKK